ncbi:hypothetical protein QTH91_02320 [Variovorax dokdonensis]|uniref:DUF4124 domain-containing protein n=1 Tax=Variovorax dokdonensis TaxID=344883 RepID=A0ABT7N5W1_9BURK|nr:hypothetical protein [Variovorax dokdonensis]MDM0043308.1 hypothetical protein [Variovorax dokdonensis]
MDQPSRGWPARAFAPAIATLICIASPIAQAAIWRCGNSYSDIPCPDAVRIDPSGTAPSAEQKREADEATRKNEAAAQRMERERLRLEAATVGRGATIIGEAPKPPSSHKHELKTLGAAPMKKSGKARSRPGTEDFVATAETAESKSGKSSKKKSKAKTED